MKIRVSFIMGMMVAAAMKGLMAALKQIAVVFNAGFTFTVKKTSQMNAKHPPRTATHMNAKKRTTHGLL